MLSVKHKKTAELKKLSPELSNTGAEVFVPEAEYEAEYLLSEDADESNNEPDRTLGETVELTIEKYDESIQSKYDFQVEENCRLKQIIVNMKGKSSKPFIIVLVFIVI